MLLIQIGSVNLEIYLPTQFCALLFRSRKLLQKVIDLNVSCCEIFVIVNTVGCKKKTGNENLPNVNLVWSICQLIVYLKIAVKYFF
jgi:hypothetical protein